ncbi:TraB/GumN family protein [Saccharospirillum salsuginis]|uniref:TraB/GumN family protein n=1 Tax=Saccharospirillum salsuginis TaxID=418750 RepID=A0A918KB90_9GAMM|nr:TraB/GumN family protein [Saccharospirillum salsuginis]GGX55829.1 TraB/GumN family protein [Saccharospirillum salsuginis]
MTLITRALIVLLALTATTQAAPIWQAEGSNTVYFFGTFHLLRHSDHPLPDVYQATFDQCDRLWLETDLDAMENPELMLQIQDAMRLPSGRLLNNELSPDVFESLKKEAANQGLPIAILLPLKPWAAGVILSTTAMTNLGFQPQYGIDTHLHQQAKAKDLPVRYLETPMEQFNFLNQAGELDADTFIEQTLTELNTMERLITDMVQAWKSGDLNTLYQVAGLNEYPGLEAILIHQRNQNWLDILLELDDKTATECIAVGALHLQGKQGLLKQFEDAEYTVNQLE